MSKAPTQVGTSTNNTTSTNTQLPPAYVQAAQQGLMGTAGNLTLPVASNVPSYTLAGFTPDQTMAFDLARENAQQAYTGAPLQVSSFGSYLADPSSVDTDKLTNGGIQQFFNPYQKDVVGTTTQQLQEANDKQLAAIRARQASEGAYGGNRGALEESEQNRNFGNTLANTTAQLNQQGYQNASQLASQIALQNAGWQQQTNLFNAQQPLQAAQIQNQLNQTNWQERLQALQGLLGTGGMQQELAQKSLNAPYTALDIFRGVVPGNVGSTSTGAGTSSQPIYGPSTFQSALGIGTLGAGLLSDRTMKTDIKKLGKDENTDLDMYAYRYKDDPKDTPKIVGPMAQDVEKRYPGSTTRVGGKMVIKSNVASMLGL
jgi:hypothetical protein